MSDSITARLQGILELRQWDRANPENPVCPGCNRRENPARMYARLDGERVCAECKDDETQRLTGCRFGMDDCNHTDCKL